LGPGRQIAPNDLFSKHRERPRPKNPELRRISRDPKAFFVFCPPFSLSFSFPLFISLFPPLFLVFSLFLFLFFPPHFSPFSSFPFIIFLFFSSLPLPPFPFSTPPTFLVIFLPFLPIPAPVLLSCFQSLLSLPFFSFPPLSSPLSPCSSYQEKGPPPQITPTSLPPLSP